MVFLLLETKFLNLSRELIAMFPPTERNIVLLKSMKRSDYNYLLRLMHAVKELENLYAMRDLDEWAATYFKYTTQNILQQTRLQSSKQIRKSILCPDSK